MKTIAILIFVKCILSLTANGQGSGYSKDEVRCMTLTSERCNVVYRNDTNAIYFHYNGFHWDQLILRGDSSVRFVSKTQIVPTKDTFELSIYHLEPDTLLFTEQLIATARDSLRTFENGTARKFECCGYIFSYSNENTLYRGKANRLYLIRNNYNDSLISFEIENGKFTSVDPDNILVIPGTKRISTISVFHNGEMILRKQFQVGD
ncbi:MAG: hypothetical protein ACFHU9_05870 [Fluviicola sp.]